MERDQAVAEAILGNPCFNRPREVVEAAPVRGNAQFVLALTDHESISDEYSSWTDELHESPVNPGRLFECWDSGNSPIRMARQQRSWRAAARRLLIEHFFQLNIARLSRGQSFLIMPAREFDGRLRLGGINH